MMMARYTFQHSSDNLRDGDVWIVTIDRASFPGSKRSWPKEVVLGTVSFTRSIHDAFFDAWTQEPIAGTRNLIQVNKDARRLLMCSEMWAQLMPAREAYQRDEQKGSLWSVFVDVGGVEQTCWNTYRRATDYASERLLAIWWSGTQISRRAEFSRHGTEGRFVFSAIEVDEYGHERHAPIPRTTLPDGTWLLSTPSKEVRHG